MKYYFDSNIFIYSVTQEKVGENARKAMEAVEEGRIEAATSVLTVDEVAWIVQNEVDRDTAVETGRKILEMPNLEILESDVTVANNSLSIMTEEELDPRDSIHIATARQHGIYTIVTEDEDLQRTETETLETTELLERIR